MEIQQNIALDDFNTFGIEAKARAYVYIDRAEDLKTINPGAYDNFLVLGGGSNVLFTGDYNGLIIHNGIKGIEIVKETEDFAYVQVGAGENWHEFVLWAIDMGLGGIENLSLIPGCVGAAPVQNIGAYGVEIKDVFEELKAWHFEEQDFINLRAEDCSFAYRDSVFKQELKGKCFICSVTFRLDKQHSLKMGYGAIRKVLEERSIDTPSIKDLSDAIISIRSSKLPDPKVLGNGGSFFKNPVIPRAQFEALLQEHSDMVYYEVDEAHVKIPAGWLIDRAGWKGHRIGQAGCHAHQALVLVNYGGARGEDIVQLSEKIQASIKDKYGISLETEVNIIK